MGSRQIGLALNWDPFTPIWDNINLWLIKQETITSANKKHWYPSFVKVKLFQTMEHGCPHLSASTEFPLDCSVSGSGSEDFQREIWKCLSFPTILVWTIVSNSQFVEYGENKNKRNSSRKVSAKSLTWKSSSVYWGIEGNKMIEKYEENATQKAEVDDTQYSSCSSLHLSWLGVSRFSSGKSFQNYSG